MDNRKKQQSKLSAALEGIANIFRPNVPAGTGAGFLKTLFGVHEKQGGLDAAEKTSPETDSPETVSPETTSPETDSLETASLETDFLAAEELVPPHADGEIVAIANGELIPPSSIQDKIFAKEVLGQTIAIEPTDGVIVSPANGTIGVMYVAGHAFSVRMADGTELLIHIGIDTVRMQGKGFRVLKKPRDPVKAGETVVEVDLDAVRNAGCSTQTMLVLAGNPGNKQVSYWEFGPVSRGSTIASI